MARPTRENLGDFLQEQRRSAQLSLRQLADLAGVSNPYLSQIERGLRKPSADVLKQLAGALRISSETLYVRAGLLDEPVADGSVEEAIRADRALGEQQKKLLIDMYLALRTPATMPATASQSEPS
jgi:transcriptional regulator with XRE-family HTH domain